MIFFLKKKIKFFWSGYGHPIWLVWGWGATPRPDDFWGGQNHPQTQWEWFRPPLKSL